MRNNVVDIIVHLMRHITVGENLKDISIDEIGNYDKSEISAAYSWVLQKYGSNPEKDISKLQKSSKSTHTPRILHYAERMMLSNDAYGYLLELYNLGLIDATGLEQIIEQTMLRSIERVSLEKVKEYVVRHLFGMPETSTSSVYLSGNETIN